MAKMRVNILLRWKGKGDSGQKIGWKMDDGSKTSPDKTGNEGVAVTFWDYSCSGKGVELYWYRDYTGKWVYLDWFKLEDGINKYYDLEDYIR